MIKLAANLSTMFNEAPFLERFAHAARAGFTACEMQFPYQSAPGDLARAARASKLPIMLINAPAGDLQAGERGLALEGGARFEAGIRQATHCAAELGCARIHVLVGRPLDPAAADPLARAADNLRWAARFMEPHGITLILEALNAHDQPGYALLSLAAAEALLARIGAPNAALMLDSYHALRRGEDPVAALHRLLPLIGHVQVSRPPDRSEPDDADNARFLAALDQTSYAGAVGCEYTPRGDTLAGLGWAAPFGIAITSAR